MAPSVDPGLEALLAQIAALGPSQPDARTPEQARADYRAFAALDGPPEPVASVVDDVVAGVPVRTYSPSVGPASHHPGTVVWIHGGGWIMGGVDTADTTVRKLANRSGWQVVSVDYRLAPEHPFPAALDDCWAVVDALADRRDVGALAVGGDSAGGNLAAVLAVRARHHATVRLVQQVLIYPVTDVAHEHASYVENADGYLLTAATMRWFIDQYVPPERRLDPEVSPLLAPDLDGVAPAYIVTAGFDPLRDEGDAYAERLAAAGVDVVHDRWPTMVHGFLALGTMTPAGDTVLDRVAARLTLD